MVDVKVGRILRILYMIFKLVKLVKLTVSRFLALAKGNKNLHKRECFSILSLQMTRVEDLEVCVVKSILNIKFINVKNSAKLIVKPCNV